MLASKVRLVPPWKEPWGRRCTATGAARHRTGSDKLELKAAPVDGANISTRRDICRRMFLVCGEAGQPLVSGLSHAIQSSCI